MKNAFAIVSRFFHRKLPVFSSNVTFHYNTFYIEHNEGLFLDVNQKIPFLDIQKISKTTKLKKYPFLNIPE